MRTTPWLLAPAVWLAASVLAGSGCGRARSGAAPGADEPGPRATEPVTLHRPVQVRIAEADALFDEAVETYHLLRADKVYDERKSRAALARFVGLIRRYPQSDKVDDAYFYGGEILREYFQQHTLALEYYRRACQTDPLTPYPARFQRAVILDYRLNMREEALAEYRNVLRYEADRPTLWARSNADYAATRILQLTGPE